MAAAEVSAATAAAAWGAEACAAAVVACVAAVALAAADFVVAEVTAADFTVMAADFTAVDITGDMGWATAMVTAGFITARPITATGTIRAIGYGSYLDPGYASSYGAGYEYNPSPNVTVIYPQIRGTQPVYTAPVQPVISQLRRYGQEVHSQHCACAGLRGFADLLDRHQGSSHSRCRSVLGGRQDAALRDPPA